MDVTFDFSDVPVFLEEGEREVVEALKNIGQKAVDYAVEHGNYQNRTGNLRRSNKYKADEGGLILYNDASYAGNVEQKGYEVISGAALYAEKRLKEEFEQ